MHLRVLGPLEAAAGGQAIALGAGHQRTILAVLVAARGHVVTTDALVHALWVDETPATARKSLQSHVSRLRRALGGAAQGPPVVLSEPGGYRFHAAGHDLDADRHRDLVERATAIAARDPAQAVELHDRARSLVRGPAFGDLAAHPHVLVEATRLDRQLAAAEASRIDVYLQLGRHDQVRAELAASLARDPLDERAVAQLMLALDGSGRHAEALARYERLRVHLADQLGVDPSPQLQDVHTRILRRDPTLRPQPAASPLPRPRRPAGNPADLIGREDDVTAIVTLLTTARLVTLTGPGGVGKTRLAERAADRLSSGRDDLDEVVTCELAGVREAEAVGDAMVTALGIQPTGTRAVDHTIAHALGDRRLLLVLDNCEHVLAAAAALVSSVLRSCPRLRVLATSRERLHLAEEHVRQVSPLPVPSPGAPRDVVAQTPAATLFVVRAQAAAPTFALDDATTPAVSELCRRLDGMPLAIELAAARVTSLAPSDLVARLDRRFSLLSGGPRHEAGRHRTLQAVVAWSYDLLEPAQADLFRRLSVFVGSFSLASAEDVCAGGPIPRGDVAGLLAELVDQSMVNVERHDGGIRYRLLDTLREFAGDRLAATGGTEAWRCAHARHHVAMAETLGPRLRGPQERRAAAEVDASIDDLRAAHAWLVRTGDVDGALRLPAALGTYVFFRLHDEITTWSRRAVAMPGASHHPEWAAAMATAAQGATNRDECRRAHHEAMESLAAAREGPVALSALWAAGTAAFYEGQLEPMLEVAGRLADLAERLEQPFHGAFAQVLRVLGHSYRDEREAAHDALSALEKAANTAGSPTMHAFVLYCRGEVHLDVHPDEARRSFERAIDLARDVDNALVEGVSLVSLASLQGRRGETRAALRLFREVVAHWRRLGDHTHQLTTVRNLVELFARIGAHRAAAELYGAVTGAEMPTFGQEARRLADAWHQVTERLPAEAAESARARGRRHSATGMADAALAHIDRLLAG